MTILEFVSEFPEEQSCKEHFKAKREKEGVCCKSCKSNALYWLQGEWQWQCKHCSFRTTLRSGSMMENSNLPFRTWYLAIAFMSYSKKGISAHEMRRQFNNLRYATFWSLMHRIRNSMGHRDAMYSLEGMVEFDEGYFEKTTPAGIKLKRGKGSVKQQNVAVMAESIPLESLETGKKNKAVRYFKMQVLNSHKKEAVNQTV